MTIAARTAGEHGGRRVDAFTLVGDTGVLVDILSFGVTVRDWQVPLRHGMRQVVLGFPEFAPYATHGAHFGAIAGRVANRIAGSGFVLDGKTYTLPANEGPNHIHGGPEGLGLQVWDAQPDSANTSVRFTHRSPDGAMGYPGTVAFSATYSLASNRLILELEATTDRPTPVSLVQHHYFNLGAGPDVLDHRLSIDASARTELGPDLLPTGAILPVTGTDYDFRTERTLRRPDGTPVACDLNLVLATGRDPGTPAAIVRAPDEALTLTLFTDRPGVQLYNGVWTDIATQGHAGKTYGKFSGLCLEDQAFPDAVHHAHFPSIVITPDLPYRHRTEIEIG